MPFTRDETRHIADHLVSHTEGRNVETQPRLDEENRGLGWTRGVGEALAGAQRSPELGETRTVRGRTQRWNGGNWDAVSGTEAEWNWDGNQVVADIQRGAQDGEARVGRAIPGEYLQEGIQASTSDTTIRVGSETVQLDASGMEPEDL